MIEIARNYILLMSIVVLGGGAMGYVKAKSKASLIAGVISAILLGVGLCSGHQRKVE